MFTVEKGNCARLRVLKIGHNFLVFVAALSYLLLPGFVLLCTLPGNPYVPCLIIIFVLYNLSVEHCVLYGKFYVTK